MSESFAILKIEHSLTNPDALHVQMVAASEIVFDVTFKIEDYHKTIAAICEVAPHMMSLDADLMESYDDAGRTPLKDEDIQAVNKFLLKYRKHIVDFDALKDVFA